MPTRSPARWFSLAAMVALTIPGFFALSSCAVETPNHEVMMEGNPEAEVYVDEAPPPPREEVVVGASPGPSYLWVGGYWTWHHSNWYWVRGRWAARPHPNAEWVAGRWEHRDRGHVWVRGHWR
jgi:hypothetical protein